MPYRFNRKHFAGALAATIALGLLLWLLLDRRVQQPESPAVPPVPPPAPVAQAPAPPEAERPAAPVPDPETVWIIEGMVIDATAHTALSGASITGEGIDATSLAVSAEDGKFQLAVHAVPEGVVVAREGYFTTAFSLPDAGLPPWPALVLPLFPASAFMGKVIDAVSAAPIPGASAQFRDQNGMTVIQAITDSEGDFSLCPEALRVNVVARKSPAEALADLSLQLAVEARGYMPFFSESSLAFVKVHELGTNSARVLVALDRELVIDGVVRDALGVPVSNATVIWACQIVKGLGQTAFASPPTFTDDGGRFQWRGPEPTRGSVVWATHPDHGPGWIHVDRPLRKGVELLEIRLPRSGRLRGRIVDPDGHGIAGARVQLQPTEVPAAWHYLSAKIIPQLSGGRTALWNAVTAPDGTFQITGLPVGTHRISMSHGAFLPDDPAPQTMAIGEDTYWQGSMRPGRMIECIVVTADDTPVPEARLRVMAWTARTMMGVLGNDRTMEIWAPVPSRIEQVEEGRFVVHGLPDAPLRVRASARGYARCEQDVPAGETTVLLTLAGSSTEPPAERAAEKPHAELALVVTCEALLLHVNFLLIDFYLPGTADRVAQRLVEARCGKAVVTQAPQGTFDLVFSTPDYMPLLVRDVSVPGDAPLAVPLSRAVPMDVTIVAAEQLATLTVLDDGQRVVRTAIVESDNACQLCGLAPGTYWFRGRGPGQERYAAPAPIVLSEWEPAVTVTMEPVPDGALEE